jgi:hypothetical protein
MYLYYFIPRPCQLRWRDCSSCALSFIKFALPRRYSPGIVRLTLQTSFHSFSAWLTISESHNRFAPRIVRPVNLSAFHFSNLGLTIFSECHLFLLATLGDSSTNQFQCTTLLKLESHYLRAFTFLVSREILREAFFL